MSESETDCSKFELEGKTLDVDFSGQNIVKVTDRSGNSIHYQLFDGVYYSPTIKRDRLKERQRFKLRPDDIYFPGYPRTGTNWTFEMASMLLNGKAETIKRFKDQLEVVSSEDYSKLPSPRIISCHYRLSDSPYDVRLKKVKIIYTLRDPKDVAVSLYNIYYNRAFYGEPYTGSFGDYLQLFLAGTVDNNGIFNHLRDAEKFFDDNPGIPVHFQRYEDTIMDPVKSLQNLSDFLGLPRRDDLCKAIADKCVIGKMKVDKDEYAFKYDGDSFLYRKGIIGDWRNYFTHDLLDDYYRVYDEKMTGSRFYGLYTRDKDYFTGNSLGKTVR